LEQVRKALVQGFQGVAGRAYIVHLQPDLGPERDVIPRPDGPKVEPLGKHVLSKAPGLCAGDPLADQACLVLSGEEAHGAIVTTMARSTMAIADQAILGDLRLGHDALGNAAGAKTHG
jgi:hypothetical protein